MQEKCEYCYVFVRNAQGGEVRETKQVRSCKLGPLKYPDLSGRGHSSTGAYSLTAPPG